MTSVGPSPAHTTTPSGRTSSVLASGAVATDEPAGRERLSARMYGDIIVCLMCRRDGEAAPDVDAQRLRAPGEHRLQLRHLSQQMRRWSTGQAPLPLRRIDVVLLDRDAGEVAGLALERMLEAPGHLEFVQQPARVQRLDAGGQHTTQAEREAFQRGVGCGGLIQNEHVPVGE